MRVREYQSGYDIKELISKIQTPKSKPITIGPPILGVNFRLKPSEIADNESPYCKNARITRNYIEPRCGIVLISSDFDANILYIREFVTSANVSYLIILTEKSLYYSLNLSTFTRLPWYYNTGTVTTQVDSPIVTGVDTLWTANARAGDKFKCDADSTWKTVLTVDSNTQITLTTNYEVARSAVTYKISCDCTPRNFIISCEGNLSVAINSENCFPSCICITLEFISSSCISCPQSIDSSNYS